MTGGSAILARGLGWDDIMIAYAPSRPEVQGRRIGEIASAAGLDPLDTAMDILTAERGGGSIILFQLDEADLRRALGHPHVMIGSDGSSLAADGEMAAGKPHPRSYGTFARVLARYARDESLLTLEQALWKMTGLPARRLGLADRGVLAVGAKADVVALDAGRVEDSATYDDPHRYAAGIPYVFVNGRVVIDNGEHTGALPGQVLTPGQRRATRERGQDSGHPRYRHARRRLPRLRRCGGGHDQRGRPVPRGQTQNTKGSTENVPLLEAGTLDLALVQGEVAHEAWTASAGRPPICASSPRCTRRRACSSCAPTAYRAIEDLLGRPVAFGAHGSGLVILARYVLDGLGLDRTATSRPSSSSARATGRPWSSTVAWRRCGAVASAGRASPRWPGSGRRAVHRARRRRHPADPGEASRS